MSLQDKLVALAECLGAVALVWGPIFLVIRLLFPGKRK